jgi:hypothetical protein
MITKQAIRNGISVSLNGEKLTKDQIIEIGENWSEKEENLFRKMLKQGGTFKIGGNKWCIISFEKIYNSKGEIEAEIESEEE